MRSFSVVLLVAACFVACAHSFPSALTDDSDEGYFIVYPRREFEDPLPPFGGDSLISFSRIWQNLYTRMNDLLKGMVPPFPTNSKSPNSTSTTKVIDGHVVTVNETTYEDTNDEFAIRIRVHVIDVAPKNDTTENNSDDRATSLPPVTGTRPTSGQEEGTTPARSVETLEDFDNDTLRNQVDVLSA